MNLRMPWTRTALGAACALALLATQACRSAPKGDTNVYESGTNFDDATIIEGNPGLARDLTILEPRTRMVGERLDVQFDLLNERSSSLAFQWRIDWFDAAGFRIDDTTATWEPIKLGGGAKFTIQKIAPRPEARTWRLQVSSPNEVR